MVMQRMIERVRGRPSPDVAAVVSLVTVAAVVAAVGARSTVALSLMLWLAVHHVGTLYTWWRGRHDRALQGAFDLIEEAMRIGNLGAALGLAEALLPRTHSPETRARALQLLAEIFLGQKRPTRALEHLNAMPEGWHLDPIVEARVWMGTEQPMRAVEVLRQRLAEGPDPELVYPLVQALLAAGDDTGAKEWALREPAATGRIGLHQVNSRLFHQDRFTESAAVGIAAFERFGDPEDAYNVACTFSRLRRLDEAMYWLERALVAGYADLNFLRSDPDLRALRSVENFSEWLAARTGKATPPGRRGDERRP
jgi:tetratricopeptide (TPR) repeat protein